MKTNILEKMKIAHYKRTPIAWSPDELSHCINKYTNHISNVNKKFNDSDIIQYHNRYVKYIDLFRMNIKKNTLLKKPSFIIKIDFGETIGVKKSSAQLRKNYSKSDLINKQIAAIINFKPKQIGNVISEVLVLGFPDDTKDAPPQ